MSTSNPGRRPLVLFLTVIFVTVALAIGPVAVAAQSQTGASGTIVVEEGQVVDEISVLAGTVIIDGSVTGDVNALAGTVHVNGNVGGDVSVAAGNVEITGTVSGDVSTASGSVTLGSDGSIGGSLAAAAGSVTIDGTLAGDAAIGAETIHLGPEATLDGDLDYAGSLQGNLDAVAGEITQDSTLGITVSPTLQPLPSMLFAIYAFVLNLLLGIALLALFPRFSDDVATRVATDPLRSGAVGFLVVAVTPGLLFVVALTVIGIPLSLVGILAFAMVIWIGIVYGRFAVARWLLTELDVDNRWLALVVGLAGGALLGQIPVAGSLLNFLIFLLGLGALSTGLYTHRDRARTRGTSTTARPEESPSG